MRIETLYKKINSLCDRKELVDARKLIEINLNTLLKENYNANLSSNAIQLMKIIITENGNPKPKLTREEMYWIQSVNKAAKDFDLRNWNLLWKDKLHYKDRPEIMEHLYDYTKSMMETLNFNK